MLDKRQNVANQEPVEMIPGFQDFMKNWVQQFYEQAGKEPRSETKGYPT